MWHTHLVKPLTIITCLSLIFGRVRSPVVGHESNGPQVVFNVHQSHRHDSPHPSLFYQVGYHKTALCNDPTVHMVPLLSVKLSEVNAVETIARLTFSQTHKDHPNDIHTQFTYSNSCLANNKINNSPQNIPYIPTTNPPLSYNNLV